MKFGQFMSYNKIKTFIEKFYQNCGLKTILRRFCVCKELSKRKLENETFKVSYLYWICNGKAFEICPNQHADPLRIVFTEDSLKIEKGLGVVSRSHISKNF